jgi:hypothetical protein
VHLVRVSFPARGREEATRGEQTIRGGRTGGGGEPRGLRLEGVALIPFFSRVIQGGMRGRTVLRGLILRGLTLRGIWPRGVALIPFFARCRRGNHSRSHHLDRRVQCMQQKYQICHRLCLVYDARRTNNMPT